MAVTIVRMKVSERVQKYRATLRSAGLRPIQIWVPDVRSRSFAAKAHRQSLAVARSRHAEDDQAFIDAISERRPA
jgi:hypothetical protein